MRQESSKKVIVIGLDGASFELLEPWIEDGSLPNLRRIKEEGVYGDLVSCLPPVTAPNWKCYSTGKNPGKLGIFWWENISVKDRRVFYPQHRNKLPAELWNIIEEKGKVGVVNMPTTYPPKEVNGFLISGPPDCSDSKFFYPDSMAGILKNFAYKVRPDKEKLLQSQSKEEQKAIVKEIGDIINTKFSLAHHMVKKERPIFLHLTIFYINVLHHFFWDDEFTKGAWKLIDQRIGEFIDDFGDEYAFFFMSDHGSNRITKVFNINTWLEANRYLVTKAKRGELLKTVGVTIDNLARVYDLLGSKNLKKMAKNLVPKRILCMLPTKEGTFKKESKTNVVDWERSKAVASGQGPIYILATGSEKEEIRKRLVEDLESLKEAGVVRSIYTKEEIYSGTYLEEAPDLILDQGKGIHIRGDIGNQEVFEEPRMWKGENTRLGLFVAYGPSIERGKEIGDMSILDLAPTILHLMNIPIPYDMDGRVLKEIFERESEAAKRSASYQEVYEEKRIKSRVARLRRFGTNRDQRQ